MRCSRRFLCTSFFTVQTVDSLITSTAVLRMVTETARCQIHRVARFPFFSAAMSVGSESASELAFFSFFCSFVRWHPRQSCGRRAVRQRNCRLTSRSLAVPNGDHSLEYNLCDMIAVLGGDSLFERAGGATGADSPCRQTFHACGRQTFFDADEHPCALPHCFASHGGSCACHNERTRCLLFSRNKKHRTQNNQRIIQLLGTLQCIKPLKLTSLFF